MVGEVKNDNHVGFKVLSTDMLKLKTSPVINFVILKWFMSTRSIIWRLISEYKSRELPFRINSHFSLFFDLSKVLAQTSFPRAGLIEVENDYKWERFV